MAETTTNNDIDRALLPAESGEVARWWWPFLPVFPVIASGLVKESPWLVGLPVDFTLLTALLAGVVSLFAFLRSGAPLGALLPIAVVAALVTLSVAFGEQGTGTYGAAKFTQFVALTLPICAVVVVLVRSEADLRSLNYSWLGLGVCSVLLSVGSLGSFGASITYVGTQYLAPEGRLHIDGSSAGSYGGVGYGAAVGLVFVLVSMAAGLMSWRVALPLAAAFSFFVIGSASRGAILGLMVAAGFFLVLSGQFRRALVLIVAMVAALGAAVLIVPEVLLQRLTLEDSSREMLWSLAWSGFLDQPLFGHGFGSFSLLSSEMYPHNIFLEVAYEMGVLGLIVVLTVVVLAIRNVYRHRTSPSVLLLGTVTAFWLAGAMVSLDLRNRILWVCLAACLTLPRLFSGGPDPAREESSRRGRRPGTSGFSRAPMTSTERHGERPRSD